MVHLGVIEDHMTELSRLTFRMPADMRAWLIRRAKRNAASLNSELVRVVRERMDEEVQLVEREK